MSTSPVCARRARRSRRGAAAVEFAIVVPVFLVMVVAILEFGRLVMVQQIITTASREGARTAILEGSTATDVQSTVNAYLANSSVNQATIEISPSSLSSASPGDPITVTISTNFADASWLPAPWFAGNAVLTASTLMRREGIP